MTRVIESGTLSFGRKLVLAALATAALELIRK
jgi:hypothetical protein